jgi:NAD(P)-dependent dehydrogenase (short-subunit alcohol dehydrogenase family)
MPALDGRIALVTGASRGIGRVIARTLAGHGADVACVARSEDAIAETAEMVRAEGREAVSVPTDVAVESDVERAVSTTVEELGGLDCLVNNAGASGEVLPFDRLDLDSFDALQRVNVTGALACVKHAAPHLRESDRASVVNIASIGGKRPYPNRVPYAVSKMAMLGLTRTLAYELGRDGVTVNSVLPGPVAGSRIEDVVSAQERLEGMENAEPTRIDEGWFAMPDYVVEPEEVAAQVAYLAGPHGRHITAQEIGVDAGGTWY